MASKLLAETDLGVVARLDGRLSSSPHNLPDLQNRLDPHFLHWSPHHSEIQPLIDS